MGNNQPTSVRLSKEALAILDYLSKQNHNVGRRVILEQLIRGEIDIHNVELPVDLKQYIENVHE